MVPQSANAVPCSGTAFIANERGATKTGTFFP